MKVFGIAGFSGSGKTVLIERLLPRFNAIGLRVSVLKRAHHNFDLDQPGKDSWRHRQAGAREVMIVGPERWALLHERHNEPEVGLEQLLLKVSPCDLVLVEGFKQAPIPKLEVYRAANAKPALYPDNPHVIAVASDGPCATGLPVFGLDEIDAIAGFILDHVGIIRPLPPSL